jgi:hypothetical protein
MVVVIDWAWAYLTRQRNARLIEDTSWAARLRAEQPG